MHPKKTGAELQSPRLQTTVPLLWVTVRSTPGETFWEVLQHSHSANIHLCAYCVQGTVLGPGNKMLRNTTKLQPGRSWQFSLSGRWQTSPLPPIFPRDTSFGFPHNSLQEHLGKPCSKLFIDNILLFSLNTSYKKLISSFRPMLKLKHFTNHLSKNF